MIGRVLPLSALISSSVTDTLIRREIGQPLATAKGA